MYTISRLLLVVVLVTVAMAQSPEPPLSDTRLTVHTLLREDIFAGLLTDDMERFSRGEKNIQLLLEKRPGDKASLLAWQAAATLYRAVRAYESKNNDEFQKKYRLAVDLYSQARQLDPEGDAVSAITGGGYLILADRLPKEYRERAWSQAYDSYQLLWKHQAPAIDKLPLHFKGELLGGLAQTAHRTGRAQESSQYVDKILELMRDTPYESAAKQWKKGPQAANASIACMTCHEAGRLASRMSVLNNK